MQINWGDGTKATLSNVTNRPQRYVLDHQYENSGEYTLVIDLYKAGTYYGTRYMPSVTVS